MATEGGKTPTPFWFMMVEDISLLLFIGVTVYIVSYILWGLMETSNVPLMPVELRQTLLGGK